MKATKHVISTTYTAEEIFAIFKEVHRLCSPLDIMADETFVLTPETTVGDWRDARDLLEWDKLAKFLNQEFRVTISYDEWDACLNPDDARTILDVCQLLANYAIKQEVRPKKLFGTSCLTASVFLDLKERLSAKGVDVSELRPSSKIAPYLEQHFSPMIEELTLVGVRVFDEIESTRSRIVNIKLHTGDVVTFRDAVERICAGEKLTS